MRAAVVSTPKAVSVAPPVAAERTKIVRNIRRLIWLYLILLVVEGALRKWIAPGFSNPLLLVRDPVVILIYGLSVLAGIFPRNWYIVSLGIIGVLSVAVTMLVLLPYFPPIQVIEISLFGFRCNFLHFPLVFIMARVFDEEDVKRIGWWTLLLMIPMALTMVAQFKAAPDAFINRTAGLGEGLQIDAGGGKIRPPGTFSFISGPVFYVGVVSAFLIYGAMVRSAYRTWLLIAAGTSLAIAVAVSGSRSCVASVLLVVLSILIIFVVRPQAVNQFGRILLVVAIAALIITRLPIFKEGMGVLSDRFATAAAETDTSAIKGMFDRTLSGFTEVFHLLTRIPITGFGLGLGTNGGARFLIGRGAFLLAENEWSRVVLESGPILGLAFLFWRAVLMCRLLYLSITSLKRGKTLPILLFAAGFMALFNGQLGQPTTLGFAVVLGGLCLAATPREVRAPSVAMVSSSRAAPKRIPGRSEFAARLHGSTP